MMMKEDNPAILSVAQIEASLAKSEAQLAAGQTVSAEVVHQRLRDSIKRLEAEQAGAPAAE